MTFEEMQQRWMETNRKLDMSIRLNTAALRDVAAQRSRSTLRGLSTGLALELAIDVIGVLAIGSFLFDHLREPRFAIPALILHLFAIASIGMGLHQLVALHALDYAAPIVEIQERLARLRVLRTRITKWTLLLAPLLWTPLMIVLVRAFLHFDAYRAFGTAYIAGNAVFGVAVIPVMLWIARRHRGWLLDHIADRRLAEATRHLERVWTFERE
jgi:hypothetical protein